MAQERVGNNPYPLPDAPRDAREFVRWYHNVWKGSEKERQHLAQDGLTAEYFRALQDRLNRHGDRCRTEEGRRDADRFAQMGQLIADWRRGAGVMDEDKAGREAISQELTGDPYFLIFLEGGLVFRGEVPGELITEIAQRYGVSQERVDEMTSLYHSSGITGG